MISPAIANSYDRLTPVERTQAAHIVLAQVDPCPPGRQGEGLGASHLIFGFTPT